MDSAYLILLECFSLLCFTFSEGFKDVHGVDSPNIIFVIRLINKRISEQFHFPVNIKMSFSDFILEGSGGNNIDFCFIHIFNNCLPYRIPYNLQLIRCMQVVIVLKYELILFNVVIWLLKWVGVEVVDSFRYQWLINLS